MSTQPEGAVIDWSTAPAQMREAFEANAKELKALREAREADSKRLAEIDRRAAFDRVKTEAGDAAGDVTLEDLGEMATDQITTTILRAKATEKTEARAAAELTQAKAMGFENVEDFRTALAAVQAQKAKDTAGMTANAVAAGSGAAPPAAPKTPTEAAIAVYREAKTQGLPNDRAETMFLEASFAAQLEEQAQAAGTRT